MVDSLAMFFGAKKRRKSPSKKRDYKDHGKIVVGGRERKLMKGINGGLYYKTKSGRTYVDAAFVRKHKLSKRKSSPKRRRSSPKRRRSSPKRRRSSPKRRRSSPKRRRSSPKRRVRRTRYGYGLGQPSLIDMMGPAGLVPIGRM